MTLQILNSFLTHGHMLTLTLLKPTKGHIVSLRRPGCNSFTSELAEKILQRCLNRLPNNTQQHLTHSSGITALSLSLFLNHYRIFTHIDSLLQSASKCFHRIHPEILFSPPYLTASFCYFFMYFSFPFVFFLSLFPLCSRSEEIKERFVFVSASYCTYTHTSSNTDCRLIKGTTYLLSTHRASHLKRLPGKLDTSKTITGPSIFLSNV